MSYDQLGLEDKVRHCAAALRQAREKLAAIRELAEFARENGAPAISTPAILAIIDRSKELTDEGCLCWVGHDCPVHGDETGE